MKTRTAQRHVTFQAFSEVIDIIINTDDVHRSHLPELYNDWFELYKGMRYPDVIEWAKFHFAEVTPDSHNFWLDKRGLMLYQLKGMVQVTGIFPIA